MCESETKRDRETEDNNNWYHVGTPIFQSPSRTLWTYIISLSLSDLHHVFLINVVIHISEPSYFSRRGDRTQAGIRDDASCLLDWSLLSWWLNTWFSCHYRIFWKLTHFPFRLSIYVIHFCCPLFNQLLVIFWNPLLICLSKVHM